MIVLGLDSGAKRCGIAIIDYNQTEIKCFFSEIWGIERNSDEAYQAYRLRIIQAFTEKAQELLNEFTPDVVVSEIIPVAGSAVSSAQRQLAATAATAFQSVAISKGIRCDQIAASTVKKALTGNGRATKAVVRKAVCQRLPEVTEKLKANKTHSDEADALAICLVWSDKYAN